MITVTLNAEAYLSHALASVRANATNISIEHLVVDDGSSDATLDIAERCGVDRILDGPRRGIYGAMNYGLEHARGRIIGFLNADDYLLPGALESVAKTMQTESIWTVGGLNWVDAKGVRIASTAAPPTWITSEALAALGWNCVYHPATYMTTAFLRNLGGFDESYPIAADYDLMIRAVRAARFQRIKRPIVAFRRHENNASGAPEGRAEVAELAARYAADSCVGRGVGGSALRAWLHIRNPRWALMVRG